MTFLIDKFDLDNQNYTFDNIIIGKKIRLNDNLAKYYIYYHDDLSDSPKDIIMKIPKSRIIYKLGHSTFKQEQIALYPNYNLLQNFITFIKEFETNISNCITSKFPNLELSSLLNKKDNIIFIKLKIEDNVKISSPLNKIITLKNLNINSEIESIIKINNIWIKDNKFGIQIQLYQLKYYPSLIELNYNFFEKDIIINTEIIVKEDKPKSIESPVSTNTIIHSNKPKNMPPIPSVEALLAAKKKLKAI